VFTSILCPVDFSDLSAPVLRLARELAEANHARLTLLHVTDPLLDSAARAAGSEHTITEQTEAELGKLLAEVFPGVGRPAMAVAVSLGEPAEEILREAASRSADLIVMGTQGRGAAERFFMGSTATRVLQRTHIPVLVVPPLHK
jgi:universal stress protein A